MCFNHNLSFIAELEASGLLAVLSFLGEGSLKMVGQQYSAEQRTFMAIEYFKNVGTRGFMDMIIADFVARYPNAMPPFRLTTWRQAQHLDHFSTVHNLNSIFMPFS